MTTRYPPSYPIEDLTRTLKIIKPLPSQIATFALIQPPPLQIVTNEHHPLLNSNQNPLLGEQMTSSTTTVTLLPQSSTTTPFPQAFAHTCSHCGAELSHAHSDLAAEAQRRISELEAQVKILTDKATAAVDKLADYEDELRNLKSQPTQKTTSRPSSPLPAPAPSRPLHSRFSSLLPSSTSTTRRSTSQPPSPSHPPGPSSTSSTSELLSLLTREQTLRAAAERRVSQTNEELEELSAQLFSEANEMVAVERRARGKLEERVRILEGREGEKRGRLEILEERVKRIERVRGLLGGEEIGGASRRERVGADVVEEVGKRRQNDDEGRGDRNRNS